MKPMTNNSPVTLQELVMSNMWEIEALINILEQKGLISKEKLLGEVKRIKQEHDKKIN